MRLLHTSDLHLGKRLFGVSLLTEQRSCLESLLALCDAEQPDAVLIAGDLYDKPIPPAEAVELCDWFLTELAQRSLPIFLISGNHDSAERVGFGASLLDASGVYLSPAYGGELRRVTLTDAYGPVDFYLMPFLKPALVRPYAEADSYAAAVRAALRDLPTDPTRRNVLLAHQFVTGAEPSESEERSVGGLDEIPADCFAGFDYVALGHLHRAQTIHGTLHYSGSPLQYAFSEGEKSVTIAELGEKGSLLLREIPLPSPRPLRELRGYFAELLRGTESGDYLHITLTDEQELPDAAARLRTVYPNLLRLEYDNTRTRSQMTLELSARTEELSPEELFAEFYAQQTGRPLDDDQRSYIAALLNELNE